MIEVDVDASVLTEVILDIEFNCDASSILTFSVSKHEPTVLRTGDIDA